MIRTLRNIAVLIAAVTIAACSSESPTATPAGPSMDGGITWGSGNGVGTGGGPGGDTTTSTTAAADSGSTAKGGITWGSGN